jgi:hypothetical protein
MIHVLPKIAVWLFVIGGAYLIFGPQSFDSSGGGNLLRPESPQLSLPPAKSDRLINYERRLEAGQLQPAEFAEYQTLAKAHQSSFWGGDGLSVEKALSDVKNNRSEHLVSILAKRGLSKEEQAIFFAVLKRDHPDLLEDRD